MNMNGYNSLIEAVLKRIANCIARAMKEQKA